MAQQTGTEPEAQLQAGTRPDALSLPQTSHFLREKIWLRSICFRFSKIAQAYTDQPVPLCWIQFDPLSKLQGKSRQFCARSWKDIWSMAAGKNLKLAGFQLQHNRAGHSQFFARSRPELFCQGADHGLSF